MASETGNGGAPVAKKSPTKKSHLELAIAQVEGEIANIEAKLSIQHDLERKLSAVRQELEALLGAQKTIEQVNHIELAQVS